VLAASWRLEMLIDCVLASGKDERQYLASRVSTRWLVLSVHPHSGKRSAIVFVVRHDLYGLTPLEQQVILKHESLVLCLPTNSENRSV
jgi:hypothetical protein